MNELTPKVVAFLHDIASFRAALKGKAPDEIPEDSKKHVTHLIDSFQGLSEEEVNQIALVSEGLGCFRLALSELMTEGEHLQI